MIWGLSNNKKIKAYPNGKSICPLCKNKLVAKCGDIKIWHWAHKSKKDCDPWYKGESPWHIKWKEYFPKECQEVIIKNHRADIKTKEGLIIELQSSNISSEEIQKREEFYKNMIWILNGETIAKNFVPYKLRYKWKWFPQSLHAIKKDVYIDLNDMFLYKIFFNGLFIKISKIAFIIQNGGNPWKKKK